MRGVLLHLGVLIGIGIIAFLISGPIYARVIFPDPVPVQPIAFSHNTHASKFQIPCLFCHNYVTESTVSGIPSMEQCIGCHEALSTVEDHHDVRKILSLWEKDKSVRWVKVYDLPDFVYFAHDRHLLAGVSCEDCHGDVSSMEAVAQVNDLSMGWCLGCHKRMKGDPAPQPGRRLEPPSDCQECHK